MIKRFDYYDINSKAIDMLAAIDKHLAAIDKKLLAIVQLRVSQINGCVYCVDLHSEQARTEGETQQRLDFIAVWQECPFFDEPNWSLVANARSHLCLGKSGE